MVGGRALLCRGCRSPRYRRCSQLISLIQIPFQINTYERDEHQNHIVEDIPEQRETSISNSPELPLEYIQTHEMIMRGLNRRFENGNLEGRRSILLEIGTVTVVHRSSRR